MSTLRRNTPLPSYGPDLQSPPIGSPVRDRRALGWGVAATIAIAVFGWFARIQILVSGMARPQALNVFYRLYAMYEFPFLVLTLVAGLVLMLAMRGSGAADAAEPGFWRLDWVPLPTTRAALVPAVAVFAVALATAHLVFHGYALSMDEFSVDFQARIFAHGALKATVPAAWQPFGPFITPVFVGFHPGVGYWVSEYLPTYAALKAPFIMLGAGLLFNPVLAGLSIVALAAVCRRLWPGERLRPWVAIALLATSSEFMVTSGSQYAMPAHLCLNLVWLWLYLRGDKWSWAAATIVGGVALGLHHPFSHALFVTPFLVRLLLDKRFGRLATIAVVYAACCALWVGWLHFALHHGSVDPGNFSTHVVKAPTGATLWLEGINISLLFTWHTPVFGLLVIAALLQSKRLSPVLQDLAWGVLLSILFYTVRPGDQGHGWGDRYAYQVLGNLVLLAATGALVMKSVLGRRRTLSLLAASLVITLAVQWPMRFRDTARFVRPFAAGESYLRSRNADVVLLRADSVWYARDLLRNDPYLTGQPTIVADNLSDAERAELEREHPGRVVKVSNGELLGLGMTRWANNH